jgi:hypothetical protein
MRDRRTWSSLEQTDRWICWIDYSMRTKKTFARARASDALLYTYGKHADDRRFVLADQRGALPMEAAKLELIYHDRSISNRWCR